MQIQAINNRAIQKYGDFVGAMDTVLEAFDTVKQIIDKVDPKRAASGWTIATPEELTGYWQKAVDQLQSLRTQTKKYEAELVSRDWRV